jgi:hypothetical protein
MNAWAGAYVFYGPGWKAERNICLDITSGLLARPTDWWKQLDPDDTNISPFLPSEIFSDDEGSMHDQERHLRIKFKINKAITEVTPKMWTDGFKQHRHDPATLAIFIKLALTPLTVFDSEWFADLEAQNKLLSSSATNLWASAYRLAGAPSAYSTTPSPSDKTAESNASPAAMTNKPAVIPHVSTPSSMKNPKGVSFEAAVKATGLFLSRKARLVLPPAAQATAELRKFKDNFIPSNLLLWMPIGETAAPKRQQIAMTLLDIS